MFLKTNTLMIASDHGGTEQKASLIAHLEGRGVTVIDAGCQEGDAVDYPEYGAKVASAVASGEVEAGIIICGTGIGISIAANRFKGVRAALCHNANYASLSREHNNANILALSGRFTSEEEAIAITDTWLDTEFEGGRHQRRIDMIDTVN